VSGMPDVLVARTTREDDGDERNEERPHDSRIVDDGPGRRRDMRAMVSRPGSPEVQGNIARPTAARALRTSSACARSSRSPPSQG
jgi:hypothetical protein